MNKILANQYIVTETPEQIWYFFYQTGNGICFKKKNKNQWDHYEILFKDGQKDFDVTMDSRGNIHLICQDQLGSIIYLMYNGTQWHKYTILQSKSNRTYPKYFKMLLVNGWINLFYMIEYKGKNLLVHQILDNNISPNVVDYVFNTSVPFRVAVDQTNNIHVYYQREAESGKLGYKIFLWSKKSWSDFISIDLDSSNISAPYFIIDKEENFHLVFLRENEKEYSIVYKRKPFSSYNKMLWDKEISIYNRCDQHTIPIIIKEDKKLWILWQTDIKIFSCYSEDDGISWSKPAQFMAGRYGDVVLLGCRPSELLLKQNIICDLCYGYKNNEDISIYILSNFLTKLPEPYNTQSEYRIPGSEVEEFAMQNMKYFTEQSELKSNINTELQKNDLKEDNIELTKLKIMFNMLKEELSQTKKKLSEINQLTENNDTLKKNSLEKFELEINNTKKSIDNLSEKMNNIINHYENVMNHELKEIKNELTNLKRRTNRVSFNDLMEK